MDQFQLVQVSSDGSVLSLRYSLNCTDYILFIGPAWSPYSFQALDRPRPGPLFSALFMVWLIPGHETGVSSYFSSLPILGYLNFFRDFFKIFVLVIFFSQKKWQVLKFFSEVKKLKADDGRRVSVNFISNKIYWLLPKFIPNILNHTDWPRHHLFPCHCWYCNTYDTKAL